MRMRKWAAVLALGFSGGLPLMLTSSTLQAWLVDEGVSLGMIGLFSLVGMPYTLKFLWAPFMDRFVPPFLGRRRGWMLAAQLLLVIAIIATGFANPGLHPRLVAALVLSIAFFSASQDIVIDAYNTELLSQSEYGIGSSLYATGYRVAMLVSGSAALILADHMPWRRVYLIMAAVMSVGAVASFLAPEPEVRAAPPRTLYEAVVLPLLEFFKRRGAFEVLAFLILYRIDYNLTFAMTTPFVMDLGFTKTDIGVVTKGVGMLAVIVGGLAGGAIQMRLGLRRSLWIFGVAQAASGLSYMLLAHLGRHYPMMTVAIAVENVCGGMANAAFTGFMMTLCDKRFTATQFALITSFMALSRSIAGAPSGFLAQRLGWEWYFLVCSLAGIPALLLLTRLRTWSLPAESAQPRRLFLPAGRLTDMPLSSKS